MYHQVLDGQQNLNSLRDREFTADELNQAVKKVPLIKILFLNSLDVYVLEYCLPAQFDGFGIGLQVSNHSGLVVRFVRRRL
jgi:hypothetical protein